MDNDVRHQAGLSQIFKLAEYINKADRYILLLV